MRDVLVAAWYLLEVMLQATQQYAGVLVWETIRLSLSLVLCLALGFGLAHLLGFITIRIERRK